jgi:hypothetical protein
MYNFSVGKPLFFWCLVVNRKINSLSVCCIFLLASDDRVTFPDLTDHHFPIDGVPTKKMGEPIGNYFHRQKNAIFLSLYS